ncbi:unnamed protein product [Rotaria sordida]|uniref:Uncharacterized protein n=1 Tax=Rotaria sordida TaxID=392033 RepID=A0A819M3T5_9BILA|nr:unnamed protein product [Rotaria sordida]
MYYSITQLAKAALALGTIIHDVFEVETTDLYRALFNFILSLTIIFFLNDLIKSPLATEAEVELFGAN